MYEAKHGGRAWEVYSAARDVHTRDRLELIEDLRDAIDRRELGLYYQPKIDLRSGQVCGFEALVRWHHPTRGLLTPDRFLALAEQSGLMDKLALTVLDQAAAQQASWAGMGHDVSVAVNLSAANLRDDKLPATVAGVIERHAIEPRQLVLEITEDYLMADTEQGRQILDQLRLLGVQVSIDDYGTGFSSLAYLRELPVNELKLDRMFLAEVPGDARAVAIIRSTVELAHSLGLRMVAEGIETEDVLALIAGLGCDVAQGYLLGRPAPAIEFFRDLSSRFARPGGVCAQSALSVRE
jgi:EAL domain-containing protein (putative c-di-GMP-specific phosphodiesterase class I)